jgi:hypothetical protein
MTDREPGMNAVPPVVSPELRHEVAGQVAERMGWIEDAARAIGGEAARVEGVFALPPEVRKNAPEPAWDAQQVAAGRELGHRLGYGAEQNVPTGLRGGRRISEGGLYWKIGAQDDLIDEEIRAAQRALADYQAAENGDDAAAAEPPAQVTEVVYAGTPNRPIGDNERSAMMFDIEWLTGDIARIPPNSPENRADRQLLELHRSRLQRLLRRGTTEYDMAQVFAQRRATYALRDRLVAAYKDNDLGGAATEAELSETVLPFGYRVLSESRLEPRDEATGQLMQIGAEGGVRLLRVDRDSTLISMPGSNYSQPDAAAFMGFVAHVADVEGAHQDPVGFMTSNTYASRVADAIRAGLVTGHPHGVGMYGRMTLAETKHTEVQPDTPLNQLPGDIRSTYDKLRLLDIELRAA